MKKITIFLLLVVTGSVMNCSASFIESISNGATQAFDLSKEGELSDKKLQTHNQDEEKMIMYEAAWSASQHAALLQNPEQQMLEKKDLEKAERLDKKIEKLVEKQKRGDVLSPKAKKVLEVFNLLWQTKTS